TLAAAVLDDAVADLALVLLRIDDQGRSPAEPEESVVADADPLSLCDGNHDRGAGAAVWRQSTRPPNVINVEGRIGRWPRFDLTSVWGVLRNARDQPEFAVARGIGHEVSVQAMPETNAIPFIQIVDLVPIQI